MAGNSAEGVRRPPHAESVVAYPGRMTNPLAGYRRVLFVHAHPDDETLSTGVVIVELADAGVHVALLTACRGEAGEVTPAVDPALVGTPALIEQRERELDAAARVLGVAERCFLGTPPARAGEPRRYTDSGMRWVDAEETTAGPGDEAGPDALSLADPAGIAADIAAYARAVRAEAIVGYDERGGYGHPDHVILAGATRAAASEVGVPFVEVISVSRADHGPRPEGYWVVRPDLNERIAGALRCHASQVTVRGDRIQHVGGQTEPVPTAVGLRRA